MAHLQLEQVTLQFPSGFQLGPLDLSIPKGTFAALIGPNGSGKTTLLRVMSGRLLPCRGRVLLKEKPLSALSARQLAQVMAVITSEQFYEFPFSVEQIVEMGRHPHLGLLGRLGEQDRRCVEKALRLTHTAELRERPISHLSSGERQRVMIARALAQTPSLLMLDEPSSHLDIRHQVEIFRLLRKLNQEEKLTVLVVLHDLNMAAVFCPRILLLSQGRLVRDGTPHEVIQTEILRAVYGAQVTVVPNSVVGTPMVLYERKTVPPSLSRGEDEQLALDWGSGKVSEDPKIG